MGVHRIAHRVRRPVLAEVHMRHLPGGVHAGVGAPGTAKPNLLSAKVPKSLFECRLHRGLAGLPLPAGIATAVIFDVEAITRHYENRLPFPPLWPRRNSCAPTGLPPAL